jgi:hypothetical protein
MNIIQIVAAGKTTEVPEGSVPEELRQAIRDLIQDLCTERLENAILTHMCEDYLKQLNDLKSIRNSSVPAVRL